MAYENLVGRLTFLVIAVSLSVQPVAAAQFGGILGGLTRSNDRSDDEEEQQDQTCEEQASDPSIGRQILGNLLGDVTRRTTSRMGRVGSYIPDAEVADTLTNAIACQLDPAEQRQAAAATEEATQRDEVGATATWTSKHPVRRFGFFDSHVAQRAAQWSNLHECARHYHRRWRGNDGYQTYVPSSRRGALYAGGPWQ